MRGYLFKQRGKFQTAEKSRGQLRFGRTIDRIARGDEIYHSEIFSAPPGLENNVFDIENYVFDVENVVFGVGNNVFDVENNVFDVEKRLGDVRRFRRPMFSMSKT